MTWNSNHKEISKATKGDQMSETINKVKYLVK